MPAESERQRRKMCIALQIKLGKTPASYSPEAAKMAKTMTIKELEDFCHSKVEK